MLAPLSTMPVKKNSDYGRGRRRILLVGADLYSKDSISTLLNTMGLTCIAVSRSDDVPATIEREPLDAVLLHLGPSAAPLERTIRTIKTIRPSLAERIVVISKETVDRPTLDLIELQDLPHLRQEEHFLSALWTTLEDLFLPGGMRKAARKPQSARLLFDSFRLPLAFDVRGSRTSGRHMTYEHNSTIIDVLVDRPTGSERISLVGQVLDSTKVVRMNFGLPVVLLDESGTLARTTTNQLGEFNLEFECAERLSLEIRLRERSWVTIPLGPMDWVRTQRRSGATAT